MYLKLVLISTNIIYKKYKFDNTNTLKIHLFILLYSFENY